MRFLSLILALLLPGLLLPGGTLLRICLCEHRETGRPAGCCAPAERVDRESSCCCSDGERRDDRSPRGGEPDDPSDASLRHRDCRCLWIHLGDELPAAEKPKFATSSWFALPDRPIELPPVQPSVRVAHIPSSSPRLRPPPDHQRTLPLLI